MITLMAPDCVRTANVTLLPTGAASTVIGAVAVAEETRLFADRIHACTTMRLNGRTVEVIAPGGHPLASIDIDTRGTRIVSITITKIRETDLLAAA